MHTAEWHKVMDRIKIDLYNYKSSNCFARIKRTIDYRINRI